MSARRIVVGATTALATAAGTLCAVAGTNDRHKQPTGLVREVRIGTAEFRNVDAALGAGYGSSGSCVTGPEEGAMRIHFPNGDLVSDPALDPRRPEILIYEQRRQKLRLVGVEFLVIADAWHQSHMDPASGRRAPLRPGQAPIARSTRGSSRR